MINLFRNLFTLWKKLGAEFRSRQRWRETLSWPPSPQYHQQTNIGGITDLKTGSTSESETPDKYDHYLLKVGNDLCYF